MIVELDKPKVAASIKRLMRDHYQHELARKLRMSQPEISQLANRKKNALSADRLKRLADACGLDEYELIAPRLRKIVERYAAAV